MPASQRLSRRTTALVASITGLVLLSGIVMSVPVPYVTMQPGPTFDTLGTVDGTPMFTFGDDVTTYETDGRLDFTSVSITRAETRLSLWSALTSWWDEDSAVLPRSFVYPEEESNEDSARRSAALLTSSQDSSRVAAMRAAGLTVPERVIVHDVLEGSPADGVLVADDRIVAIDGEPAVSVEAVADAIADRKPGDEVVIRIAQGKTERDFTIETAATDEAPDRPRVGITVKAEYDFPIEIENHIGDRVGGSSAGMMFALSMYDQLTEGALTGGLHVAGTGTISASGDVGAIGGVPQKLAGAEKAGAGVFLVPESNCPAVLAARDFEMTLVKVGTLDEAIRAIETLAEDPEAEVPTC